ncbi:MAG: LD-carboxypeptidase [Micromonosporaceae bacterium]|nr:LD-carboxypeptidase [Micromonosporaceae bacterium]
MPAVDTVRPPALRPGDSVMLVSPAGPADPAPVARGTQLLESWGLRVVPAPHVYSRHGYLAGTDEVRLADLDAALRDPGIRGVICTRGGYGAQRIVDGLATEGLLADPKLVVGFSDITALHLALWRRARLATVHGPGASWRETRTPAASARSLRDALMSSRPVVVAADPADPTHAVRVPGRATGPLLGGNLSLLVASVGTPDFPDLAGAILLIEDVGEAPYRVDRMLVQLRRAGALRSLAGVAVGQFTDCTDDHQVSIVEVLAEQLGGLGIPVLGGLPVGHGYGQLAVPLGVPATLDTAAGTLTAEPATLGD